MVGLIMRGENALKERMTVLAAIMLTVPMIVVMELIISRFLSDETNAARNRDLMYWYR